MSDDIDWEVVRQKLDRWTKDVDGHITWIGGYQKNGRFNSFSLNKKRTVYPYVAYGLLQEHDRYEEPVEGTKFCKTCSVKSCISHAERRMIKMTDYTDMTVNDQLHTLKMLEDASIEEKCPIEGLSGPCRIYQKGKQKTGYCRMELFGKTQMVHRVSYFLQHFGEDIPDGAQIYHLCGNRACINGQHLECGDAKTIKNYFKYQKPARHQKLTLEQIKSIGKELSENKSSDKEIAKKYDVSDRHISSIKHGHSWKDLMDEEKIVIQTKKRKRETDKACKPRKREINHKDYEADRMKRLKEQIEIVKDEQDEKVEHWIFIGQKNVQGYGEFSFRGRAIGAHKASYLLHHGLDKLPKGVQIRHKCRFPACVNIEHLETGTAKENAADRVRDGTELFGEKNPSCKITKEQAKQVKESKGKYIQTERAKMFNVPFSVVRDIDTAKTWKHI